ncbi:MAG: hypothetical protein Q9222_004207, partial [Ikaeria aurantiellina]
MLTQNNTSVDGPLPRLHPSNLHVDRSHQGRVSSDPRVRNEKTRSSPKKPVEVYEDKAQRPGMHKKSKSSVSLKSLIGNDKARSKPCPQGSEDGVTLKRPKSSTGLSALLSRSKAPKEPGPNCKSPIKDKENRTPPHTADIASPPIWAQFASQQQQRPSDLLLATNMPLGGCSAATRDAPVYTPQECSPSKQRNFHDHRPTLTPKTDQKPRPKSEITSAQEDRNQLADSSTGVQKQLEPNRMQAQERSIGANLKRDPERSRAIKRPDRDVGQQNGNTVRDTAGDAGAVAAQKQISRGSRVMAAVAALGGTHKDASGGPIATASPCIIDVKAVENDFEALLEMRNIPHNVRDKMRSLDTTIKVDFIQKQKSASGSMSSTDSRTSADQRDVSRKRPMAEGCSNVDGSASPSDEEFNERTDNEGSPKKRRSRPRSRTFTFSKGESSPKKRDKSGRPRSRGRSRSRTRAPEVDDGPEPPQERPRSFSFGRTPKPAIPEDFLSYLRNKQKPQDVEVGRLQKLRQLLRNETVIWVDAFVSLDGMAEIIGLLNRILKVEWREEHEDTLLHETLLCLKAMCTTSVALKQLSKVASTLFPTLIGMLFDEERKGPSEFTTRNVVMSLLFIHLTAPESPTSYESRAKAILQYLRDPSKPEEARPPGFIAAMHSPRPYRIWCKEIVNVTKEVFWIFLHHVNVIPYPQDPAPGTTDRDYRTTHFPQERPPIPAAPYIGGVEWDATNYLATHLDLLNGLIACLPTQEERNGLRRELRDSGFEKCMGGSLRTCKEKWYGYVHAGLTTW